ncbi:MAG: tRNA1(Val) (adenine(37)-N6)-methyltransferase [Acholeplasmataceae bacterium]|nr:tRNA1(Val) (adenine(37)-N6)-methyltransferase [Acholeplasmataceae bacterium]
MAGSELIHDLLSVEGLKIIQTTGVLRFSLDSVLLANFVSIGPRTKQIMDFGTGLAPIPLLLSLKTNAKIIGIELQEELCQCAEKSVRLNGLDQQIDIVRDDIRVVHSHYLPSSFDLITCNPPFFPVGSGKNTSQKQAVRLAKHEETIDFHTLLTQAGRLLKTGGKFVFVHRAERLEELILALNQAKFALKRLQFVYSKPKTKALTMLVEASAKGKQGGLKILDPLVIQDENGQYTLEALAIFRQRPEV